MTSATSGISFFRPFGALSIFPLPTHGLRRGLHSSPLRGCALACHPRQWSSSGGANLAALFDSHKLKYESQAVTEGKNKPDFIFPDPKE